MAMAVELTRRRFTADEYLAMVEAGILREDDRVELIDGDIVAMTPIGWRHGVVVSRLNYHLVTRFDRRAVVQSQSSHRLDFMSEPQPDFVVLAWRDDFYAAGPRPGADAVLFVVEVADSSLRYDLTVKAGLYARHGIREYWVVDVTEDTVIRHTEPVGGEYRRVEHIPPESPFAPIALPDVTLTLADVFGPR